MKRPTLAASSLLLLAAPALAQTNTTLPIRLVTFNIRYAATSRAPNEKPWSDGPCTQPTDCRRPHVINQLTRIDLSAPPGAVTLLGLQEVLAVQLADIKTGLGGGGGGGGRDWAHIGVARDDGAARGEYCPILYRTDALRVLYAETKWLSPTPDSVSYGWGAGSRRVVTVGVFEAVATGTRFIHANTHLDNVSGRARVEGIKVVLARIRAVQEAWGPLGVSLTGDFNSEPGRDGYRVLAESGYMRELFDLAGAEGKVVGANRLTFTGFTPGQSGSFIDFIWIGPAAEGRFTLQRYEILSNVVEGVYISDHRAVVGDVTLVG
ncbi:hypothetical protein VTK56DRAFT_6776 [Thermocarpiscus australiensis]